MKKQTKADYLRSNKIVRQIIILLLFFTAAFDFFTFAAKPQYHAFDMSFLTVITGSVAIIFLVKLGVISLIAYLLGTKKPINDYLRYLYLMMAVYLIFFQTVGGFMNLNVAEQAPAIEDAPSVEVRVEAGLSFVFLWAYYPMVFSMLCFWLFRIGWRKMQDE